MNVYDFDGTIYKGDSTVDFFLYVLKKKPSVLRFLPKQIWGAFRYKLHKTDLTGFKERFFCFLKKIDADAMAVEFWQKKYTDLYPWYLESKQEDDVIISASPEFLLKPICDRLGVGLIASRVDPKSGSFTGSNCKGEEKVTRFRALMPDGTIDKFYSDSLSDAPMAKQAKQAFFVKKGVVEPWKDL